MAGMTIITIHTNTPALTPDRSPPAQTNNDPPQFERAESTSTDGRVIPFPINNKLASQLKAPTIEKSLSKRNKLEATKSGKKGFKVWTITIGKTSEKGGRRAVFRIREETRGYRTHLRYWDGTAYREPYCCYLSAKEWQTAKKGSVQDFSLLIFEKIEQRKANEGVNSEKIDQLLKTLIKFGGIQNEKQFKGTSNHEINTSTLGRV